MTRIFLAAPLTQKLRAGYGMGLEPEFRAVLADLHRALAKLGHHVVSAHEREAWGEVLDPPEVALRLDLEELDGCDAVVALIGDPPSPGVQLEIGYAIARRKPILALVDQTGTRPYLLDGLPAVARAKVIVLGDATLLTHSLEEGLLALNLSALPSEPPASA